MVRTWNVNNSKSVAYKMTYKIKGQGMVTIDDTNIEDILTSLSHLTPKPGCGEIHRSLARTQGLEWRYQSLFYDRNKNQSAIADQWSNMISQPWICIWVDHFIKEINSTPTTTYEKQSQR